MMKNIRYGFFALIIVLLYSCASLESVKWIKTGEEISLYLQNPDTAFIYTWQGDSFEGIANGNGTLIYSDNEGKLINQKTNAFYGAINNELVVSLDDGSKFIGNIIDDMMTGYGVLVKDRDLYIGEFLNSKPNGYLKLFKNNKLFYDGNWNDGTFNGEGTLYKEDGTIKSGTWDHGKLTQTFVDITLPSGHYKGYARNGKPDGLGKMEYANGTSYQGKWSEGLWNGEGLYVSVADSVYGIWEKGKVCGNVVYRNKDLIYEGTFDNNSPLGVGNLTTKDGTYYSGMWLDGKRCGMGDMIFANGDRYSGDWTNNAFDGFGEYHYVNQHAIYQGEWKEGLQHGNGLYKCPDFSYDGEWDQGWMDGDGTLVFKNKDKYEGTLHENIIDGVGCYTYANGNRYEGEFVEGKLCGLGAFQFKNGNRFEGEFYNGKIYGDGTMYLKTKDGFVSITGFWPLDGSFPKEASILFANGDLYEGPLNKGVPTDAGTWVSGKERQANIDKVENSAAHKVNELYKKHRETIDYCLLGASVVVTAVEIESAGSLAGIPIAVIAQDVNMGINVVDAGMAITSAAIDVYENDQLGEDNTEATKALATEVGMNVAFIVVPKVLAKAAKPLGKMVKNVARSSAAANALKNAGKLIIKKSAILFTKGKVFGKSIKISISETKGYLKVEKAFFRTRIGRAVGSLLVREKHQMVKYASFLQKVKTNPEIKSKLKMSLNGDPKNLRHNLSLCGTGKFEKLNKRISSYNKLPRTQVEAHHVIPSNPQTENGRKAKEIWNRFFDSVDHPCNGIWLGRSHDKLGYKALAKGTNHVSNSYKGERSYEAKVSKALIDTYNKYKNKYAKNPEMMQKVLAETVDNLKEQLYKGKLAIGSGSHTVHTPWSIFTGKIGVVSDASQNIIIAVNHLAQ